MQQDEMIATLVRHKGELEGILSRFEKTHDGIHIDKRMMRASEHWRWS